MPSPRRQEELPRVGYRSIHRSGLFEGQVVIVTAACLRVDGAAPNAFRGRTRRSR